MEQLQESPFLDVEAKMTNFLDEKDELLEDPGHVKEDDTELIVQAGFVKEKGNILQYVYDLILDAAKTLNIPTDGVFAGEEQKKLVANLKSKITNVWEASMVKNRVTLILMKYLEQPTVLDCMLSEFIEPIMKFMQLYIKQACLTQEYILPKAVSFLLELLYNLCNVRGHKTVVKFMPHEAADMEPCVELLHFQESQDEYWIPCMLTLWLSIIVLVPFDLQTIDSKKEGDSYEILVKRIINISFDQVQSQTKLREFSSVLIGKILTRPDVIKGGHTAEYLTKVANIFTESKEASAEIGRVSGILQTMVEIFKIGHRDDLISMVDILFAPVVEAPITNKFMTKSTIIRKNRVKLAQRIGCIFLKPKVTKWRYKRGSRTLNHLIKEEDKVETKAEEEEDEEMLDEDDINFEQLEFIIQLLLESLQDEDNVVRWTAAKGLGRITQRLTKDFADQIVEQLMDLFSDSQTDSSWHGGCLALAELCRRGLLLPERLEAFIPILDKALIYDINRGNHSVGSHVRDSACYVVWSFARAYTADIMKPHIHTLSNKLMIASLFDREVNCRRAASATYQECVGRQGNFPHGIEILTEADYFTLSNRVNAYLNVSCFIGQFPEYLDSMVKHLAFVKLQHWDVPLRVLASQSLSVLCIFNPELVINEVMVPLIEKCFSKALHIRHGAILGVSEILIGLSGNSIINRKEVLEKAFKTLSLKERQLIQDSDNQAQFKEVYDKICQKDFLPEHLKDDSDNMKSVRGIIERIEKEKLYKGKGGEIMRAGVCHLIHAISIANIQLSDEMKLSFFKSLEENFRHPNPEIQDEAAKAFKSFCKAYFGDQQTDLVLTEDHPIMKEFSKLFGPSMQDHSISVRRGFNLVFGQLTKKMIDFYNPQIFETLMSNCNIKKTDSDDAETRKQSVKSLLLVVETVGLKNVDAELRQKILETFYIAMNDYAVDRRGDVGSWVRQGAMTALQQYIHIIATCDDNEIKIKLGADKPDFYQRLICQLMQQLCEKIDNVREQAGRALQKFFKFTLPHVEVQFAQRDDLAALFIAQESEGLSNTVVANDGIAYLPWRSAHFVYQSVRPFYDSEAYSMSIFKGLITSSGGLTESSLKESLNSLFEYLNQVTKTKDADGNLDKAAGIAEKKKFLAKLLVIFESEQKNDRVTVPLMKTIEQLLTADYLSDEEIQDDLLAVHRITVAECNKSKNITKLIAGVGVFSGLMGSTHTDLCQKSIKTLLFLLYHNFPKVRIMAAEKLYTGLLTMEEYDNIIPGGEDAYDEVNELISETDWAGDVKILTKETKVQMYAYFGHEVKLK